MPLFLDTARVGSPAALKGANCVSVGLVNNMPDAAFEATERQFVDLIRAAAPDTVVLVKLFTIPQVPRAGPLRKEIAGRYRDIAELWDVPLDGLIVTGTEPRAGDMTQEPYWETLSAVVDWARDHTASTIWSCLAAHAAVLHVDGIARSPFERKLFGVFDCRPADDHPMTRDMAAPFTVPHSRYNDLPLRALKSAGYRILSESAQAGADIFARQDGSFFLFFQGHPEYDVDTLLREYRRDAARFLAGERATYPAVPENYFCEEAAALAQAFRARALAERSRALIAQFPRAALETGLVIGGAMSPWRQSAVGIYEKWVAFLKARKAERRPLEVPLRRTWRDWPLAADRAGDGTV